MCGREESFCFPLFPHDSCNLWHSWPIGRCHSQHPTSPAGTNDNNSFDMAADPALGRGGFGEFAIQHSWYLHGRAIFSISECLDNERLNYLCRLTQINSCRRLIAAIGLFEDVGLALKKSGVASTEFQEIMSELENLADIRRVSKHWILRTRIRRKVTLSEA